MLDERNLNVVGSENLFFSFFFFSSIRPVATSVELEIEFSQIFRPIFQIFFHFRFLRVTLDLNFNTERKIATQGPFEKQDQGLRKQDGYTYILGRNDPSFTFSTEINDERTKNFDACQNYGGTILKQDSTTGRKMEILKDRDREKTDSRNLLPRVWIRFANLHFQSGRVPGEVLDGKSRGCTECTVSRYTCLESRGKFAV